MQKGWKNLKRPTAGVTEARRAASSSAIPRTAGTKDREPRIRHSWRPVAHCPTPGDEIGSGGVDRVEASASGFSGLFGWGVKNEKQKYISWLSPVSAPVCLRLVPPPGGAGAGDTATNPEKV